MSYYDPDTDHPFWVSLLSAIIVSLCIWIWLHQ